MGLLQGLKKAGKAIKRKWLRRGQAAQTPVQQQVQQQAGQQQMQQWAQKQIPQEKDYSVSYDELGVADRVKIDYDCDREYQMFTPEFEREMGNKILKNAMVMDLVNNVWGRVQPIVDAWIQYSGKKKKAQAYKEMFSHEENKTYFGSIDATMENVQKATAPSAPARLKLKLIYDLVGSSRMATMMRGALLEMQKETMSEEQQSIAFGGAGKTDFSTKSVAKGITTNHSLKSGYASASGLRDIWESDAGNERYQTLQKMTQTENSIFMQRMDRTQPVSEFFAVERSGMFSAESSISALSNAGRFSNVLGSNDSQMELKEQRTLTMGEVDDLSDMEIDMLLKREKQGKSSYKPSSKDRAAFRARGKSEKVLWKQGTESIDMAWGTDATKDAFMMKSVVEAGVSGSTGMMMRTFQALGFAANSEPIIQLRTVMAGWMMANRDHSFYEVMRAAVPYCGTFQVDQEHIGMEYEIAENINPVKIQEIEPDPKKRPAYIFSDEHKNQKARQLFASRARSRDDIGGARTQERMMEESLQESDTSFEMRASMREQFHNPDTAIMLEKLFESSHPGGADEYDAFCFYFYLKEFHQLAEREVLFDPARYKEMLRKGDYTRVMPRKLLSSVAYRNAFELAVGDTQRGKADDALLKCFLAPVISDAFAKVQVQQTTNVA